jgi:hypothetical protein
MVTALCLATAACIHPPPEPPAPKDVFIQAPFDSVWQAAIAYFADSRISIETIDKESGLIVSRRFLLDHELTKEMLNCGADGMSEIAKERSTRAYADFNVFLRRTGDSTAVRVNVGGVADASTLMSGRTVVRCVSTGTFEAGLLSRLRAGVVARP